MNSYCCITVRFLERYSHGRSDSGEPEWPPSPLRVFQALIAASAARWNERIQLSYAVPALEWLERQSPPTIAATVGTPSNNPYLLYIPNNAAELVVPAWRNGNTNKAVKREQKVVRPMQLTGEEVHFLYPLPDGICPHFEVLQAAARSITHLGWGIDMVAGNAEILTESQVSGLPGEVWRAVADQSGTTLRVPKEGTLDALMEKHQKFLGRLSDGGFKPVPPLSTFRVVGYRRATEPSPRQFAAFSLLKPDTSGMRTFDSLRRTRDVAGMVRHAVADAAHDQGWLEDRINMFIHGKTPDGSKPSSGEMIPDRFQYLPLPTINHALGRVESIRRVLIAAPSHCGQQIAWVRRALAGAELVNRNNAEALLTILPGSDWVLRQYVEESKTWATVTPVILPGYDDPDHLRRKLKDGLDAETQKRYLYRLNARMEELLRKAFRQAGYSSELVEQTELDWREVGFCREVELASRYLPPDNLNGSPRIHVRIRFPTAIRGPIAVGSGRFRGFGLFAKC
jgi:CRISPR-associated protein Csb2